MNVERYYETEFENYDLSYYLLKNCINNSYGVGIKSKKDSTVIKSSFCYNISNNKDEMVNFLKFLCRTTTFPTTLNDMVEDWLFEKSV